MFYLFFGVDLLLYWSFYVNVNSILVNSI